MLPQCLAADRPRAASQAERERDQHSRHRLDEAARRQEHGQPRQRGEQGGGEGGAVPPPETVVFDIDEQVERGVHRQPGQRRADTERVDVHLRGTRSGSHSRSATVRPVGLRGRRASVDSVHSPIAVDTASLAGLCDGPRRRLAARPGG